MTPSVLLSALLLPLLVGLLLSALHQRASAGAVVVGIGAGVWIRTGPPALPLVALEDFLPWAALGGALWSLRRSRLLLPLLVLAVLWPLTVNLRAHRWSGLATAGWLAGLVVVISASWALADRAGAVVPLRRGAAGAGLWALAVVVALVEAGSLTFGLLALNVAGALIGAALPLCWRASRATLQGAVAVAVPAGLLLLTAGVLRSELPLAVALLLALAPGLGALRCSSNTARGSHAP